MKVDHWSIIDFTNLILHAWKKDFQGTKDANSKKHLKFLELIYKQSNTVWRLEIPLLCNFLDLNETENYFLNYITTPIFWHFLSTIKCIFYFQRILKFGSLYYIICNWTHLLPQLFLSTWLMASKMNCSPTFSSSTTDLLPLLWRPLRATAAKAPAPAAAATPG